MLEARSPGVWTVGLRRHMQDNLTPGAHTDTARRSTINHGGISSPVTGPEELAAARLMVKIELLGLVPVALVAQATSGHDRQQYGPYDTRDQQPELGAVGCGGLGDHTLVRKNLHVGCCAVDGAMKKDRQQQAGLRVV